MLHTPFYDPQKSYEENFEKGPFGAFATCKGDPYTSSQPSQDLKSSFFGIEVDSPFGIPAGPLINGKFAQAALDMGFDIVTYKTVRSGGYRSHPWPNVLSVKVGDDLGLDQTLVANNEYSEPLSITNSFGVPSLEPEFWQKDIRELVKNIRPGQVIVGAFQGTKREAAQPDPSSKSQSSQPHPGAEAYIQDFKDTARLLKETGVKVMEVNLSCPNEGTNNLLCYDTERSVEVVQAIKKEIGDIPLIIKIGYYKDAEAFKNFIKKIGDLVQGISAINTIAAEILDEKGEQALPGEGRRKSGVCGHAIKWAGLDMVARLRKLREELGYKYTIIGVGGVMSAEDFKEYRKAGADFVMSATGAMWNPYLAQEIKKCKGDPYTLEPVDKV